MKFQPVKGTRDFYPEQMRLRNWISEAWRRVSLRNGFEEYDAPIFEYLDLFTIKSGQEIAEQLFHFTDRGGRNLAIRPEITPSLARMVAAKINSLPRPIKWFSIPRLCRAENPQRGRLREFFQWNIDIIGSDSPAADAECVFVAVDVLRELGLTSNDIRIKFSSRALLTEVLKGNGIGEQEIQISKVLSVIDKRSKVPKDAFEEMLRKAIPDDPARMGVLRFLDMSGDGATAADSIAKNVGTVGTKVTQEMVAAQADIEQFENMLKNFGIADWCEFDTSIVRGLAYYTGIVYEVFDAGGSLRALAGGGRYDNLLDTFGGPATPATGFGMGDVILAILLEEKGGIPEAVLNRTLDFFVIDGEEKNFGRVLEVVGALRTKGYSADYSFKRQAVGKQLKEANRRGAARATIIRGDTLAVKDLTIGQQQDEMPIKDYLNKLENK